MRFTYEWWFKIISTKQKFLCIFISTVITLLSILSHFVHADYNNDSSPTLRPSKSVAPTSFTLTASQAYKWNRYTYYSRLTMIVYRSLRRVSCPRIYPQSCTCVVSGALKKTCELFKCTCTCDLTAQVCDFNCCCDPDCSDDQVRSLRRFRCPTGHATSRLSCAASVSRWLASPVWTAVRTRAPPPTRWTTATALRICTA